MIRLVFDFPGPSGRIVFAGPRRVLRADRPGDVRQAIAAAEEAARAGSHVAGFVTYEAAPAFDPAFRVHERGRLPLLWLGVFDAPSSATAAVPPADALPPAWQLDFTRDEYDAAIAYVHEAIRDGRTYQVNLTVRLRALLDAGAEGVYERLRAAQGPGFHAFLDLGEHAIISTSPELFFDRRGELLTTRPMKGTRPRGRWPEEDARLADELRASPKERAENLMIVDLLRNDLGRIARVGSVEVERLFDVERYRTVWQMTSTITARARSDVRLADVFAALFPCGSVTGAPKISTMEIIARLERAPRGVYCGAIGWIRPGGDCTFSVPIRTLWLERSTGRAEYGVGSGITADATARDEYEELRAKAGILRAPAPGFELLETMRVEHGRVVRLDRHLARLAASAAHFDFAHDARACREAADVAAAEAPRPVARLRLLLSPEGAVRTELQPLEEEVATRAVALALRPVDSGDVFLFHKTTRRATYDAHAAEQPRAWDVLLWNERGELTEFTRGNLVVEIDGEQLTPPREAGLLAGTLRAELLEHGEIREATLQREDLARATHMWFVNSLRGRVLVRVVAQQAEGRVSDPAEE